MQRKRNKKSVLTEKGLLFSVLIGACSSLFIFFFLLFSFSAILLSMKNPHPLFTPLAIFSIYSASFFGGFVASKANKEREALYCGLLCGGGNAIILCSLFWLISFVFKLDSSPVSWIFGILIIPATFLGALLASKRKPRKRKKRRKR